MKLYERFAERGYHTSIATTFGIDFDSYESIVLSRLRGAGCHNNILMADTAMLLQALEIAGGLPRHAGRLYTVSGMKAGGVFHPKLFLQLGRKGGRMIVSSANITPSGLGGNLELAGEIASDESDSGEQRLLALAWRYTERLCGGSGEAVTAQIAWMQSRTPWLRRAKAADGAVTLNDGTQAALLTAGSATGIGRQLLALIGNEAARRLIVVSPYWDDSLEALGFLVQRLSPGAIAVIIDQKAECFPVSALRRVPGVQLFGRGDFREGRFLHAKLVIAQTRNWDHVLCGSANCTVPALGKDRFAGTNEEVCLYRRLPAGAAFEALELDKVLVKSHRIDARKLKVAPRGDDLDLAYLASRSPGRFECHYDVLIWTPPGTLDPQSVTIELLDAEGMAIDCTLTPQGVRGGEHQRFLIGGNGERPSFARIRHRNGDCSAPSIVTLIDEIKEIAREPRSKRVEDAATRIAEETEEGLWLLDVLNTLEAAEREQSTEASVLIPRRRGGDEKEENRKTFRKLSYAEFMAGRKPRKTDSAVSRSSLSGSELSLVRGFMNRILGLSADERVDPGSEDPAELGRAFDLGDETSDPEGTVETKELKGAKKDTDLEKEELEQNRRAQRKASQKEIVDAAVSFIERLAERRREGTVTTFDVLRLRALLMIIAAAGWSGPDTSLTSWQVLPVEDLNHNDWPRLLGRTLFGFFGGTDPVIRHVQIDRSHDQLSDDILESWATCFWAVQACLNAPVSPAKRSTFEKIFFPTAERVYRLTGLTRNELLAESVITIIDRINQRFAVRLGVDGPALAAGHKKLTGRFFPQVRPERRQ